MKKQSTKGLSTKNEIMHSKNNLNNASMLSQNLSVHSGGSMRSFRNSIDNGVQAVASAQNIYPMVPTLLTTNISRKTTVQRNSSKKNKTFVSSSDINNELGELVEEGNSSLLKKQNSKNESQNFQMSSNSIGSCQKAKRKLKHSRTVLIQSRNSLQNTMAIQKLETLEINKEEDTPENKIYIEDEKKDQHGNRRDTITQQNKKEKELAAAQEPMLKVSRYLLRYLNGKDDILKKFELSNSNESSKSHAYNSHIIQVFVHILVLLLVFFNLGILSTKEQILLLIMKAVDCGISISSILLLPKLANRVLIHKICLHSYVIFSHANSYLLSTYFQDYEGILHIIFIEHICVLNMIQNFSFAHFNKTFPHAIIVLTLWLYVFYIGQFYYSMVKICIFILFQLYRCYVRWDVKIQNFNNLVAHEIKKSEKDNLLKYLVPKHILTQFLQNKKQYKEISESLEKVTLLFADIAGFTSYSSNKHPSEVVHMLRNLFTSFDQLCLKHKVYKVYTIGDCYVVLGIMDKYNRSYHEECKNVVEMGFSMIQVIENIKKEHEDFKNVNMRIGIHLGEKILGGIIGTNIVRYDIFGKDVVIANKMESNGQLGKVNVSEDTKKFLENHYPNEYIYEENKEVDLNNFKQDGHILKVKSYFIQQGEYQNNQQSDE